MKKLFFQFAVVALFVIAIPAIAVYANDINVTIDGRLVVFEDQGPVVVDGRTLVPVRGVFETIGFSVSWIEQTQQVNMNNGSAMISLGVGADTFTNTGVRHNLDVPAQIIAGRTMLPLRAILETVGFRVTWDERTQTVVITSARAAVGENVPISNAAIAGVPISRFYGLTSNGVTDIFGPPEFGNFLRHTYNFPDGYVTFSFTADGSLVRIEAQASTVSANGITLDRNRAELMSMFGRATLESPNPDRTTGPAYEMIYAVGDYKIAFLLDSRYGSDVSIIEVIMEPFVQNPLG